MRRYPPGTPGIERVVGNCRVCGITMLTEGGWAMFRATPQGQQPTGYSRHVGQGLCLKDYRASRRRATSIPREPKPLVFDCATCGRKCSTQKTRRSHPELRQSTFLGVSRWCYRDYEAYREETREQRNEYILEDWVLLRDNGELNLWRAAQRLGLPSADALEKRLYRAKLKGDPRGSRVPFAHDMRRSQAA